MKAIELVSSLIGENCTQGILGEASVHKPARGHNWVASFTGPEGGQKWKSTGTADYNAAMAIAQELEAEALQQRILLGLADKQRPRRRKESGTAVGGLSQREIAARLGVTERTVRAIEVRALRKLAKNPEMQALWRAYSSGELT